MIEPIFSTLSSTLSSTLADILLIAALVQGVSEFLPVSSSGHLVLLAYWLTGSASPLWFDIAAHGGTLAAGLVFFRRDVKALFVPRAAKEKQWLFWLIMASCPVLLFGAAAGFSGGMDLLRLPIWTASAGIVFALLLAAAAFFHSRRTKTALDGTKVLLIGLAQVLALIPGVSRTGVTLSAALALGVPREDAARFSLLLALPVIAAACGFALLGLWREDLAALPLAFLVAGLSFLSALAALAVFWHILRRNMLWSLYAFAVYRVLLGGAVLAL